MDGRIGRITERIDHIATELERAGKLDIALALDRVSDKLEGRSRLKEDFPIKPTWTPGEYGNWEGFRIKEAFSQRFRDALESMIFNGVNVLRNGIRKKWNNVSATGFYFTSPDGSVMIEVDENGKQKHLNIATFTGEALSKRNILYKFVNGKIVATDTSQKIELKKPF